MNYIPFTDKGNETQDVESQKVMQVSSEDHKDQASFRTWMISSFG